MTLDLRIEALDAVAIDALRSEFSALLTDCVEAGASIGFMSPLLAGRAEEFWRGVAEAVARGDRILWTVRDTGTGTLLGTVQLIIGLPDNQPHRGDVAKLMVSPQARRRGVADALMAALEAHARNTGLRTLVLDTVTGSPADALYRKRGWVEVGAVPDYALFPDGSPCSTTFFYKTL
ncbi:GCN5 family acetyltransferase [Maricaulis sp. W15]|uniref:GNAT family N-acetyltransferase n=1 Tax=Maricaulis sp. W15 TaxID=1772333 RepID=UPI00094901DC|nr:GNAT family N-acetyltransferase [Maricaulis sp. W15]OLF72198.1 GCN5 family acetyltransferase [Maricaulis sp. W15]